MSKRIDLTGCVFGRLTVIEYAGRNCDGVRMWLCRCACGNETVVRGSCLTSGHSKSCGCGKRGRLSEKHWNETHGGTGTRLYFTWKNMRNRCRCKSSSSYKFYGERGVKVCAEWNDFAAFRDWALLSGYADNLTIERIDFNGNYCPENCCWIPRKLQAKNTRSAHVIEFNGEALTQADWARRLGIDPTTLCNRIKRHGAVVALSMKRGERCKKKGDD